MTPKARKILLVMCAGNIALLEKAWQPLCDELIVTPEELSDLVEFYKDTLNEWVENRRFGETHYQVNQWLQSNKARIKNMGLGEIIEYKTRKRLGYCSRRQLTVLVCMVYMHIRWKLKDQPPVSASASDSLIEAGYKPELGGKFSSLEENGSSNYKDQKRKRFAEIDKKDEIAQQDQENEKAVADGQRLFALVEQLASKPEKVESERFMPPKRTLGQKIFRRLSRLIT